MITPTFLRMRAKDSAGSELVAAYLDESADRIAELERQNADLLTALRACCGVLSGENMQKSSLVRALELSYVALANAKGEQTAVHSLPDEKGVK